MKKIKLFVIYFPVILIIFQVAINVLSFIAPGFYMQNGFVLNTFFGVNLLFALFLLAFTYWFNFCSVSRYAAWAEVLFAINYLIVQQDNLYNIMFQIIIGVLAIILTFKYYIKKFPLCSVALITRFLKSFVNSKGDCQKAADMWEQKTYNKIQSNYERRA
jgi:hypothetical protein